MDPLDAPKPLYYNNGKVFPPNIIFIGYLILGVSVFILFANIYIGTLAILISMFFLFTTYSTLIDLEKQSIFEYTSYLGFIKIGKTYDYKKFQFMTVIPTKLSYTSYSRANNSTTNTDYFFTICLLNERYRNKQELTKFKQKSEANETCRELAHRLGMEFFEYDPRVIREKMQQR